MEHLLYVFLLIDIFEYQHFCDSLFRAFWKTTPFSKHNRILVSSKYTVPNRDVTEIVIVNIILVMH